MSNTSATGGEVSPALLRAAHAAKVEYRSWERGGGTCEDALNHRLAKYISEALCWDEVEAVVEAALVIRAIDEDCKLHGTTEYRSSQLYEHKRLLVAAVAALDAARRKLEAK